MLRRLLTSSFRTAASAEALCYINGVRTPLTNLDATTSAADFLRQEQRDTSVKISCGEGICGSCSILVQEPSVDSDEMSYKLVNSCTLPAYSLDGLSIITASIADREYDGKEPETLLRLLQDSIYNKNGAQCGYCTPGVLLNLFSTLTSSRHDFGSEDVDARRMHVEDILSGNQCRCTGYRPIFDSIQEIVEGLPVSSVAIDPFPYPEELASYDPPESLALRRGPPELGAPQDEWVTWFRPRSAAGISAVMSQAKTNGETVMIRGGGVESHLSRQSGRADILLDVGMVGDAVRLTEIGSMGIAVGGQTTLQALLRFVEGKVDENDTYRALRDCLRRIGTEQVRAVATVGGALRQKAFPPELRILLSALRGSEVTVLNSDGAVDVVTGPSLLTSEALGGDDDPTVILDVMIPFSTPSELPAYFKVGLRRSGAIALVCGAFNIRMNDDNRPEDLEMTFGGIYDDAATPFIPAETLRRLQGAEWTDVTLREAILCLNDELQMAVPPSARRRAMRITTALSLFLKYFKLVQQRFDPRSLGAREASLLSPLGKQAPLSTNIIFNETHQGPLHGVAIGNVKSHMYTSGDAQFVDDVTPRKDELSVYVVESPVPHGRIVALDTAEASQAEGVVRVVTAADLSVLGSNIFGATGIFDEEMLASEEVHCVGQPVALVVAESLAQARNAAKKVVMEIEELPALVTIAEAVAAGSYFDFYPRLKKGDFKEAVLAAKRVKKGSFSVGGQDHQYGETHASIAYPEDADEMVVLVASQDLSGTQKAIAMNAGIPQHKIVVKSKRMGGGFGGKQSRGGFFATLNALAAKITGRPTRLRLDRGQDMRISGGRHPFRGDFEVGFDPETGVITALKLDLYSNSGHCVDMSVAVMDKAILCADQAYEIPNTVISALCCKTNLPSNTAFRGFGGPQSQMIMESIIEFVAEDCGLDAEIVRRVNMYQEGDVTPCGVTLTDNHLPRLWEEIEEMSNYRARVEEVKAFNSENQYRKRGIHVMPAKVGMGYCDAPFLNWGQALVHVYQDGTVLVSIGGTEMGQGLYSKVSQVVASTLDIPLDMVNVIETSTDKSPNQPPTAASIGTDAFCGAARNAALTILDRLAPLKEELKYPEEIDWSGLLFNAALLRKMNLTAAGYYEMKEIVPVPWSWTPEYLHDWEAEEPHTGDPFPYLIYGAVATEVEVDCLTGEFRCIRADMIEDAGHSINPLVDIGQTEGAFVQGMGWVTMEEVVVHPETGAIETDTMHSYKIPLAGDAPEIFNVGLLGDAPCPTGFMSSKTAGEPPLFLGTSVFFAIRNAVQDYRRENGIEDPSSLVFNAPATVEKIRMACADDLVKVAIGEDYETFQPYSHV